jgi:hypothetical protein
VADTVGSPSTFRPVGPRWVRCCDQHRRCASRADGRSTVSSTEKEATAAARHREVVAADAQRVEVLETSSLFRRANSQRLRSQEVTECERIADARSVVHCSPSAKRPFVPPAHKMIEFELEKLEAPPGFEPGVEVLQISLGSLSC